MYATHRIFGRSRIIDRYRVRRLAVLALAIICFATGYGVALMMHAHATDPGTDVAATFAPCTVDADGSFTVGAAPCTHEGAVYVSEANDLGVAAGAYPFCSSDGPEAVDVPCALDAAVQGDGRGSSYIYDGAVHYVRG